LLLQTYTKAAQRLYNDAHRTAGLQILSQQPLLHMAQRSAAQRSTAQRSAAQHSAAQHSTAQHSMS